MIVVDVEGTGTDPRYHSLVSIGAIDFDNPEDTFYKECRIFDGAKVEKEALEINGMTHEELVDPAKATEAEAIEAFLEWIKGKKDHTLAGQNPSFDLSFLLAAAERAHLNISLARRTLDLHSVCWADIVRKGGEVELHNNRSNLDSDKIMEYVGIPTEPRPHIALNGALYEAEAFSRLFHGKNLLPQFKEYPIKNI